jgi:hypothetical protein
LAAVRGANGALMRHRGFALVLRGRRQIGRLWPRPLDPAVHMSSKDKLRPHQGSDRKQHDSKSTMAAAERGHTRLILRPRRISLIDAGHRGRRKSLPRPVRPRPGRRSSASTVQCASQRPSLRASRVCATLVR